MFQFATATKNNKKNSNKMESLQVDGPITERAYIGGGGGGGLITGMCFLFKA